MIDSYGRKIEYLRVSVTDHCNMRCRYCMPEDGVDQKCHEDMMTEEETIMAIRAASSIGIKKIRLTGGEPLVKKNIISICERTVQTEGIEEVCMTTNGVLLPKYAGELRRAGVKRLNISLDTLNSEKFSYITRIGKLDDVMRGIDAAFDAGFEKIKINTVLIGGFNTDEIADLAALTQKMPVDVRFIEMMPMYDGGEFGPQAFVPFTTVTDTVPGLISEGTDGVARLYRLPGAKGNVGLISPVSAHFCMECNRLRLTADGKIKPCLHSEIEYSIRGKDISGMRETFITAINEKPKWHGELSYSSRSHSGRNMNAIGG